MQLTTKQKEGLKIAVERYKHNEKYTVISGYAGTGKSTLIRFIIKALPICEDDVVYATFTGKAAQILSKKGNKNVTTLHKLLYESFPRSDGTFYRVPKDMIGYSVVIVDEISMVPKSITDLLFSHKDIYVICLGDPFQLPPIHKDEDNHLLDHPHIFLDEIMRQATESEIVRLSMDVRNYRPFSITSGKEVQILNKKDLNTGMMLWADQILVATNKTRINLNNQMRNLNGFTSNRPMEGDKVICARNYWGVLSNQENDLINGTIGYLSNKYDTKNKLPIYVGGQTIDVTIADFKLDNREEFKTLAMDTHMIMTGEKCVDVKTAYKVAINKKIAHLIPYEFNYGYAITVHRAQGSEWNKILVVEENFPCEKEEHARWLYTAITRASEKLVLIR